MNLKSFLRVSAAIAVTFSFAACSVEQPPPSSAEDALSEVVQARRQAEQLGFLPTQAADYHRAENHYREALLEADAGDLRAAAASAARAVASYRAATLNALNEGFVQPALANFEKVAGELPPRQQAAARRQADRLTRTVSDARGGDFELGGLADQIREAAISLDELVAGELEVFDPPCPTEIQPQFFELTVSEAAEGTLLARTPIHYVAGSELDVALVIPRCTFLTEIFIEIAGRSYQLATDASVHDPIEGTVNNPFYYSVLGTSASNDRKTLQVRLHFPAYGDGRTLAFRLLLISYGGQFTAEEELVVVSVSEVNGTQAISLSEHQLRNDFVVGTYEDFGDNGRKSDETPDLIAPSYSALSFDVSPDGIFFRSKVKADLPVCDPTITTSGVFHLESDGPQVEVAWDVGPSAGISLPLLCELGTLVLEPLRVIGRIWVENMVEDQVKTQIQGKIDALIAEFADGPIDPATFIQGFELRQDELLVLLDVPGEHVALDIPYSRLRLEEWAFDRGMALNPGEQVLIMAGGLVDACTQGGFAPQGCESKKIGPAGLFNWSVNVPIPSPWPPCSEFGTCAYFKQRHRARTRLKGLRRDESKLPFPERNVGALVGRLAGETSTSRYRLMDGACSVTTTNSQNRLAFGPNDFRYVGAAELGTGTWRVSVVWPPSLFSLDDLGCEMSTFSLPNLLLDIGETLGTRVVEP